MDKKTKKMVALEAEIARLGCNIAESSQLAQDIANFKPETSEGKTLQENELNALDQHRANLRTAIETNKRDLELATITMLAGKDTDMADPTPAESLRNAS